MAETSGLEVLESLLLDKPNIAIHAAGAFGNFFILESLKENYMTENILQTLVNMLSNPNPYQQKVVLQTITIIINNCKFVVFYLFFLSFFI